MRKIWNLAGKAVPLLGFICLAAVILFQIWFESVGREAYFSEQIVKLKKSVGRGDEITSDSWYYAKVPKNSLIEDVITDPNEIVGKVAKQYIPNNAQLHPTFFEEPELITDENHLTMKIPNEWIYALPNTLRARDKIVLKEVTYDVIDAENAAAKQAILDLGLQGDASAAKNVQPDSQDETKDDEAISTYDDNQAASIGKKAGEIVLRTTVAYVKDSSNREVVSVSKKDRNDGTSVIRDVEIVATVEEVEKLEQYIKKGSKFLIMYQEG